MWRFDEASYLRLVRGQTRGLAAGALRAMLGLASVGYGVAVAARNRGFDRRRTAVERAPVPVVSVGNLTLGGTGKTPMVEWVARQLRARGRRVVILSRGYGRQGGLNDEGLVLEENLPDVPHLQGANRAALARVAAEELEAELLVLDDGFQHRRLARDLDLVLLDALEPFGLGRMFPRGLLREPTGALRRASVVVLSRADLVFEAERQAIRAQAERHAGPLRWAEARHAPLDLVDSLGNSTPLLDLHDRRVAAFCGIGNPEGFRRTLLPWCGDLLDFHPYPDHHAYTAAEVGELAARVRDVGADLALTTQKDLVKLRVPNLGAVPLRALRIGLEFLSGEELITEALSSLAALPAEGTRITNP